MNYQKIVYNDMVNGEGIRTTLFVSGCEHACRGCYNQATWNPDNGTQFTEETLSEIIESLRPNHISGLSLTGGDPLHPDNLETVIDILVEVKSEFGNTKDIWLWSGYDLPGIRGFRTFTYGDSLRYKIVHQYIDVFIDGKFIQELHDPSLEWRGSSNQIIHKIKDC